MKPFAHPTKIAPLFGTDLLDFDQGFVRRHAVALFDMDADHDAADGRLDFVFHLHGFDDQYAIPCLDLVPDLDLNVDNGAGHGGCNASLVEWARAIRARCRGCGPFLAVALSVGNLDFVQYLDHDFFRNAIDRNIERALRFSTVSAGGVSDLDGFASSQYPKLIECVTLRK